MILEWKFTILYTDYNDSVFPTGNILNMQMNDSTAYFKDIIPLNTSYNTHFFS